MLTYKAAHNCMQLKNKFEQLIALQSRNYPDKFDKAVLIAIASKMDTSESENKER